MEPGQRDVVREVNAPIAGASPGDAITEYYLSLRQAILRGMRMRLDELDIATRGPILPVSWPTQCPSRCVADSS
jgi:hypothetical protein